MVSPCLTVTGRNNSDFGLVILHPARYILFPHTPTTHAPCSTPTFHPARTGCLPTYRALRAPTRNAPYRLRAYRLLVCATLRRRCRATYSAAQAPRCYATAALAFLLLFTPTPTRLLPAAAAALPTCPTFTISVLLCLLPVTRHTLHTYLQHYSIFHYWFFRLFMYSCILQTLLLHTLALRSHFTARRLLPWHFVLCLLYAVRYTYLPHHY